MSLDNLQKYRGHFILSNESVKKPFYKKWWVWVIAIIILFALIVNNDEPENEGNQNNEATSEENANNQGGEKASEEQPEEESEPEPIPDPNKYEGTGDSVIKIESPDEGPVVLYVKGNSEGRHFAVKGYDENDNQTELFVNTTDAYEGITLDPSGTTTVLEIKAQGSWVVEARSYRSMRTIESPGSIEGSGDEVLLVEGDTTLATISGNKEGRHFAVKGYNPRADLLVNTTDVYEGTTKMSKDTFLLEVIAGGDWSIEIE